jgi:hypothetical protein
MSQSGQLVFQYFFYVGSGVGLGLAVTLGGSYLAYKSLKGKMLTWRNGKRR